MVKSGDVKASMSMAEYLRQLEITPEVRQQVESIAQDPQEAIALYQALQSTSVQPISVQANA